MTELAALPWLAIALALPYGLVVGIGYFLLLRRNTRLLIGSGPVFVPILMMFGRLAGAVVLLGLLVPAGWAPTLAGLAGFTVARPLVVARLDRHAAAGGEG
ncbi:MAG: ATP synthase subunit I [Rhodospirillaceae bacterium]